VEQLEILLIANEKLQKNNEAMLTEIADLNKNLQERKVFDHHGK